MDPQVEHFQPSVAHGAVEAAAARFVKFAALLQVRNSLQSDNHVISHSLRISQQLVTFFAAKALDCCECNVSFSTTSSTVDFLGWLNMPSQRDLQLLLHLWIQKEALH